MIGGTIRASLRYRWAVLTGAAGLTLLGLLAARTLEIDVLPDISRPTLSVMTEARGLASEEVENLVTRPVELALAGLPGTIRMRSTSAVGLSVVNVELDWGADVSAARQQVTERLGALRDQLPSGMAPQIQPVSSIMGEIMLIALRSAQNTNPAEQRNLADWVIRPRLAAISGVSQVIVIGGDVQEFRISPRPALMAGLDISLADLERAIAQFGANAGGGFVDQGASEYVIRIIGTEAGVAALGKLVVAKRDSIPVLLGQVAHVNLAAKPARGSAGADGRDAVLLSVQKYPQADTRAVTAVIDMALRDLQSSMPAGTRVDRVIFKQSDFISVAIDNVGRALIESVVIVAVILFLFLANTRTVLVSLIAIPLSLLTAMLAFRAFGLSVNTMTLGGLAIALGELVDDAVVGVENVFRRLQENAANPRPSAVLPVIAAATEEVRSGIFYATIIIILVLLPLLALSDLEGRMLAPLAIAYIVALLASLVTALTVTPVLCALLLPVMRRLDAADAPLVRVLKRGLTRLLPWTFDRAGAVVGGSALVVAVAVVLLLTLPRSLMPAFNEGTLTVQISALPGITLSESSRLGAIAEHLLLEIPEVSLVGRRTGRAELDEHAQGVQTSEIDVRLKPSSRSRADIVDDVRQRLAVLPVALNVGQPISHRIDHLLSGVRAEIVLKVFGDDIDRARAAAERLRQDMARVPGMVDLQVEPQARVPTVEVRADDRRAALYGATPAAVADTVTTLTNGRTVSQIVSGARRMDVTLRLEDKERTRGGLAHLLVETPGGRVPVSLVAQVAEADGYNEIQRENGRRRVAVYANTTGGNASQLIRAVRDVIARQSLPAGYSVTLEGAFSGQEQATTRVIVLGLVALGAVFVLLLGRYQSTALVLIIMASVPLSLIGGVVALAIAGLPLSLASVVGFITLAGISMRNSILKVSHYLNLALFENVPFSDGLIVRGSLERLTPVTMTAAAASFALLPLLVGADAAGKEILHPVAVVVFGGLVSATALDTVLTPLLFRRFGAAPLARLMQAQSREGSMATL